jgi:hypothetical protein
LKAVHYARRGIVMGNNRDGGRIRRRLHGQPFGVHDPEPGRPEPSAARRRQHRRETVTVNGTVDNEVGGVNDTLDSLLGQ